MVAAEEKKCQGRARGRIVHRFVTLVDVIWYTFVGLGPKADDYLRPFSTGQRTANSRWLTLAEGDT